MVMQPNMMNNNALPPQQQPQTTNQQMMYNNPNLQNRMPMQGNQAVYQQQQSISHPNYQSNNVQNTNGGYMRMNDPSAAQMTNNNGPMMVNGMMSDNHNHNLQQSQTTPMQSSAMMNSTSKPMMSMNNSYNSNNNLNMSNNGPMQSNQQQQYNSTQQSPMNNNSMNVGPMNSSINNLARAATRSSPYPNPGQYMTQKRAFNAAQQPQSNLYQHTNSQGQMLANPNHNVQPPVQHQQQMLNNGNGSYMNNTVSPVYNGPMPGQQQQQYGTAAQQSMNTHSSSLHYGKPNINQQQGSINSSYMSNGGSSSSVLNGSNNTMSSSGSGQYHQPNASMVNHPTMSHSNNAMMTGMQPQQQQQRSTLRPVNSQMNNNTSYPTPPHSQNFPNSNSNYSNYDHPAIQPHSTNNHPIYNNVSNNYNNATNSINQVQQQQINQQMPTVQQQQPICNQSNNPMNSSTNSSNLMNNKAYNQHSPIPGNPTPPLTPYPSSAGSVSSVNNNSSTNSQIMSSNVQTDLNTNKPLKMKDEELRLVTPVKGGMVMEPFQLEHDLEVTNCVFKLKPNIFNQLMTKPDLELQLKSFLKDETNAQTTNWPAGIQISVNSQLMPIDRGESSTSQKPLFLKKYCQNENNTLQIVVRQCCCQYLFAMQVVHCSTVKSAMQNIMHKQLKPVEFCVTKIKQNFNNSNSFNSNSNSMSSSSLTLTPSTPGSVDESGLEPTSLKLSLRCPISLTRIKIPARGNECKHLQCFDLGSFLILNADKRIWRCPLCPQPILSENLEVDQYILNIISTNNSHDFDEITVDANASWKLSSSSQNSSPNVGKLPKEETELNAYQQQQRANNCTTNNQFNSKASSQSSNYNQQSFDYQQQSASSIDYQSSTNANNGCNQLTTSELNPLAAMEKTIQQHDFNSIGRTPGVQSSSQTDLSSLNNQSPNSKTTINKSSTTVNQPASTNSLSSTANTPNSNYMLNNNNSPHTPHTPHTPSLINHNNSLGPSSVISNHTNNNDINDLNFDPVVINEEAVQEHLNVSSCCCLNNTSSLI